MLLRRVRSACQILKSNPGGDFSPPLPSPGPRLRRRPTPLPGSLPIPGASGSLREKIIGPNLAPGRLQDRRLKRFFRSWTRLGANFAQRRTGKAPRYPNHPKLRPPNHQKRIKTLCFFRFLDVQRICQNCQKCSQNPPWDPPKPDKLRPRSDQDLPSWGQDGHLVAILAHLGRDFAHLGASFAGFFRKFVATSGES